MAISLGTPTLLAATTGQNPSFSHTHAAGTELIVLVCGRRSDNTAISSVTYDGAAMTVVETSPNSGAASPIGMVAAYRLADPGGKTANVQINWASANVVNTAAWAIDVAGSLKGSLLIDSSGSAAANNYSTVTVTHTRSAATTYSIYVASRTKGAGSPSWTPTAPLASLSDHDGAVNTISCTLCGGQESSAGSLSRVSACSTSGGTAALCISLATSTGRSGSLAATLASLTAEVDGDLALTGSLAATLASLTAASAGNLTLAGSLSATLGALTSSASGTHDSSTGRTASLSATLVAVSLSAGAVLALNGGLSGTLGALSLSSAGKIALAGSVTATLGNVSLSSAGKIALKGSLTATLGGLGLAGSGSLAIKGTLTATLGALGISAAGGKAQTKADLAVTLGDVGFVSVAMLKGRKPMIPRSFLLHPEIPSVRRTSIGCRPVRRFR